MAVLLNGTSDYLDVTGSGLSFPNGISWFGWIKPTALSNAYSAIITNWTSGTNLVQFFLENNGKLALYIAASGFDPAAANVLSVGTWYHVGFSSNVGANTNNVYINGVSVFSGAGAGALSFSTDFWIGRDTRTAGRNLAASVADAALYNRGLTAAEVAQLYSGISPLAVAGDGLVGYWPMDGTRLQSLSNDRGPNGLLLQLRSGTADDNPPGLIPYPKRVLSPIFAEGEMPALQAAAPVLVSNAPPSFGKKTGVLQTYSGGLSLGGAPRGAYRIDWSNPITRGFSLVQMLDGFNGAANPIFIDNGGFGPVTTILGNFRSAIGGTGFSSSGKWQPDNNITYNVPTTAGTCITYLTIGSWGPTDGAQHQSVNMGTAQFTILSKLSGDIWSVGWSFGSNTLVQPNSAGTFSQGDTFSTALTWNSSGTNFYTKGILRGTRSGAPATGATTGAPYVINSSNFFQTAGQDALYYVLIWNRVLSDQEIAILAADPYCFLVPAEGEMPALRSTAAPTQPAYGWQQPPAIAPKIAQAFPTQATGFSVPPSVTPSTIAGMAWYRDLAKAWPAAKAFPTQPTGFSVPPPIAVVSGTLATTELTDIASFTVTYTGPAVFIPVLQDASTPRYRTVYYKSFVNVYPPLGIAGILATTEAQDVAAFNATFAVTGILVVTEGQDTASFTGSGVAPSGTLAVTEAPDTAAFTGNVVAIGTLAVTEAQDTGSFNGTVGLPASGTLAVTEGQDVASFTGTAVGLPIGILAVTELPDNVIILADYRPPPTTISPSPYPSRYDYGWYDRKKIRKR